VVDRYFAREAGSRDTGGASYRLIRTGFGDDPDPAKVLFVRDMAASVPPSVRADTFRAMTGFDLRPRLGEIATPVLLVVGGRDRLVSSAEAKDLAPRFRNARVEEFPDAGHALFLERHERFTALVREVAARHLGPKRPARPRTRMRPSSKGAAKARTRGGARARTNGAAGLQ
jgi:pimeloyl-ACP methyl ester carboxylesterase